MHYSYEFKLMCVELYLSGSYPDIPEGVNPDTLKSNIRQWARLVDLHGPEVLKHKVFNKVWTPEEKFELVSKVIAGIPKKKVAIEAGINPGMLYQWLHKYKLQGYNGLVCGDFKTAPDDSLTDLICHKCGSTVFSITMDIEIEDKEQFIEECVNEYPDRFSPDDYINSFDWITINVCCQKCSKRIEWISLELS